ncbi:prepilin peptidase [Hutsoniella sourekii]
MVLLLFLLGACIGSFFFCLISNINDLSHLVGRSRCDFCNHTLSSLDLFPIFSILFLKFRCRYCHHPLSLNYFLFEFLSAFVFLISYVVYASGLFSITIFITLFILLMMTAFDLHYQLVPDSLQILLFLVILSSNNISASFSPFIFSTLIFFVLLSLNCIVTDGLGGADIKLLSILTLQIGPQAIFSLLLYASLLALFYYFIVLLLTNKRIRGLPFVPFILLAYLISILMVTI